jgi:hypothetical protein
LESFSEKFIKQLSKALNPLTNQEEIKKFHKKIHEKFIELKGKLIDSARQLRISSNAERIEKEL